jgi:hypothetical protein
MKLNFRASIKTPTIKRKGIYIIFIVIFLDSVYRWEKPEGKILPGRCKRLWEDDKKLM